MDIWGGERKAFKPSNWGIYKRDIMVVSLRTQGGRQYAGKATAVKDSRCRENFHLALQKVQDLNIGKQTYNQDPNFSISSSHLFIFHVFGIYSLLSVLKIWSFWLCSFFSLFWNVCLEYWILLVGLSNAIILNIIANHSLWVVINPGPNTTFWSWFG